MVFKIEKARETGFCFGVRRAIDILQKAVAEHGHLETLGAAVHNEQVLEDLKKNGIEAIDCLDDIKGKVVAISAHGISPQLEGELRAKKLKIIDTTCPFVKRAQMAAHRLAEAGFFVIVFGDAQHSEVKGILGWAHGKSTATIDANSLLCLKPIPRRIGTLSQTTQIPENFSKFAKDIIDITLRQDSEIRIIDTICHDICKRQSASIDLAKKSDLILVVGGASSANTRRLGELCAGYNETHLVGDPSEINPEWLRGKKHIGVTSGTSTSEKTIDRVIKRLQTLSRKYCNS